MRVSHHILNTASKVVMYNLASTGMETYLGGKGFNQSVTLAKAGVSVDHAGMIGEEGEPFLEACKV